MAADKKYLEEAKQMLSGGMEANRVQLNNSFNQNVQSLEGQKAGVNQNFGNQLEQNTINTTGNKNQYLNNNLARGLGRSTIATSGAAGIQDSGNRRANYIEQDKVNALGNIEAQKVILQQSLQESLLGLTSKYESEAMSLAMQLEDRAWNRSQALSGGSGGSSGGSRRSGGSRTPSGSQPSNNPSAVATATARDSAVYNNDISTLQGQSLVPSSYAWNRSLIQAELTAEQQRRNGSGGGRTTSTRG